MMRLWPHLLQRLKIAANLAEPLKLALVVRSDLRLSKGKTAAQCAHAAIACYESAARRQPSVLQQWLHSGQPKIVLRIDTLEGLERLQLAARRAGLTEASVADAGRTQVAAGTVTVLGIGPAGETEVNALVGELKLL